MLRQSRVRWSPDGRSFLVNGRDAKGRGGLYRIDAETGDVTAIVQNEPGQYNRGGAWSPDGKAIFYIRVDLSSKSFHILRRDLETGQETELYRADDPASISQFSLALSPDGRQLAFILGDLATRSNTLNVMSVAGGEPRELLRLQEPNSISWQGGLAWTPDGREIVFGTSGSTDLEEQTVELWRISAEGGEPQRLELAMDQLRNLRFHPDGRRIAFASGRYAAEVWLMENFLPALKAAK